jgi:N-acetylneuraminic acid mutarotase
MAAIDSTNREPKGPPTMKALIFTMMALAASAASQARADSEVLTGSLLTGRYDHTATLLPNGKVLVFGGYNNPLGNLATAELYDPAAGNWSYTGSLGDGRWGHTATLLPNGKVLVAGGSGANAATALYDPAKGTWSKTAFMDNARYGHSATLLRDGKVLVAGGFDATSGLRNSAELYDPATATWSKTGAMNIPHYMHSATLLANGQVLIAGGETLGNFNVSAVAELYDPATGTWHLTSPMHATRFEHPATLLPGGSVLVNGGVSTNANTYLSAAELYDPGTGAWQFTGSMATEHGVSPTATLLPSGKVLVVAGGANSGFTTSAEIYNPVSGTWAPTLSLHKERGGHTATLLPNGTVLIAGGVDNQNNSLAICELYDVDIPSNTPPTLNCPETITAECGTVVTLTAQVADADGDPLALVWRVNGAPRLTNSVPARASVNLTKLGLVIADLPLGTNIVDLGVTDGTNTIFCSTAIALLDTTAPVISSVAASPTLLWPPNHKMRQVEVRASVGDTCSAAIWKIIGVRSEQGDYASEGNSGADCTISGDHTLLLRAEPSEIYYITVQAADASGNRSQPQTVKVRVAKSQGPTIPWL